MRFLVILVLGVCVATGVAAAENPRLITVTGEGRVEISPDMARLSVGVSSRSKTAADAMRETSLKMAALLEVLEANMIEARDIQTSQLSLNPQVDNNYSSGSGAPRVVGFVANNTVTVRLRDLAMVGDILDQVLETGANEFHGLSFGLQDPAPTQNEARRRAVIEARARAALYAEAAGVTLGQLMTLNDGGAYAPQGLAQQEMSFARSAMPIASGELSVQANVTLVFAIED